MSFEERNTWIGLVIGIGILAGFGLEIRDAWRAGSYDGPEGLTIWARQVIWVIPIGVGAMIVATVLGHVLYGIATGGHALNDLTDERDRQIGLWGLRVTLLVTSLTFLAALAGLAWGWTPLVTLNLIFFGFWLGSFIGIWRKLHCIAGEADFMASTPISNTIRRQRFDAGEMTQKDLAARCGVTRQTIVAIENAKYSPTLDLAFRIARAFGKPLEEIFIYEEPPAD